jgi:hypothetical protein
MPNTDLEILRQIERHLGDLLAVQRLIHSEKLTAALRLELGDGTRRAVWERCDGIKSGAEIGKEVGVSTQRISQILTSLADKGLVSRSVPNGPYEKRLSS